MHFSAGTVCLRAVRSVRFGTLVVSAEMFVAPRKSGVVGARGARHRELRPVRSRRFRSIAAVARHCRSTNRVTGRTCDQLYNEAKNLGIEGCSRMNKEQLQRAVDRRK